MLSTCWISDVKGYRYVNKHPLTNQKWPKIPQSLLEIWKKKKVKSATIITGNLKKNGLHSLVKNILINKKLKYKMINSGSFFILIN